MGPASHHPRRAIAEGLLGAAAVLAVGDTLWPAAGADITAGVVAFTAVTTAVRCGDAVRRVLPSPGSTPVVLGLSWMAMFACVPETSDQMFHVAALLVMFGTAEVVTRTVLPWWLHATGTAVVAWAGLYGSAGRDTALVGALFALWPFVLPAIVAMLLPASTEAPPWIRWSMVFLAAIGSITVARSGALGTSVWSALEDVAVAMVFGVGAVLPLAARGTQHPPSSRHGTGNIDS